MFRISKFVGVERYLNSHSEKFINLTFEKMECLIGEKLCDSAYKYRPYWQPSKTHVLPNLILDCGYKISHVDLNKNYITLTKI